MLFTLFLTCKVLHLCSPCRRDWYSVCVESAINTIQHSVCAG